VKKTAQYGILWEKQASMTSAVRWTDPVSEKERITMKQPVRNWYAYFGKGDAMKTVASTEE